MEMLTGKMYSLFATGVYRIQQYQMNRNQIKSCVFENCSFINGKYHGSFAVIVCGSIDVPLMLSALDDVASCGSDQLNSHNSICVYLTGHCRDKEYRVTGVGTH